MPLRHSSMNEWDEVAERSSTKLEVASHTQKTSVLPLDISVIKLPRVKKRKKKEACQTIFLLSPELLFRRALQSNVFSACVPTQQIIKDRWHDYMPLCVGHAQILLYAFTWALGVAWHYERDKHLVPSMSTWSQRQYMVACYLWSWTSRAVFFFLSILLCRLQANYPLKNWMQLHRRNA